jgi:hypothetical protein
LSSRAKPGVSPAQSKDLLLLLLLLLPLPLLPPKQSSTPQYFALHRKTHPSNPSPTPRCSTLRNHLLPALVCLLFAVSAHAQTIELYHPAAPLAARKSCCA